MHISYSLTIVRTLDDFFHDICSQAGISKALLCQQKRDLGWQTKNVSHK